jgi:hypothetical protein
MEALLAMMRAARQRPHFVEGLDEDHQSAPVRNAFVECIESRTAAGGTHHGAHDLSEASAVLGPDRLVRSTRVASASGASSGET